MHWLCCGRITEVNKANKPRIKARKKEFLSMVNSNPINLCASMAIITFAFSAANTITKSYVKRTSSNFSQNEKTNRESYNSHKETLRSGSRIQNAEDKTEDEYESNFLRAGNYFNDIGKHFQSYTSDYILNTDKSTTISDMSLSSRIISTKYGKLQGIIVSIEGDHNLRPLEVFLGVPYATPPIASNRFSPTKTLMPWDGVRISDHFQPVCPQKIPDISQKSLAEMPSAKLDYIERILPFLTNQSEDCLYLNIFTPFQKEIEEEKRLPVVIYIHGESFEWGSGNPYDGALFADQTNSVTVTLNYRLGVFGFLNANPRPHVKARVANYGLMDQIAALHWVQQNIALFGGDPSNVTLMGHGTGAACINFLMMSPTVVTGLFHRAILMSGSALSSWAIVENPVYYALVMAKSLNCTIPKDLNQNHETIVDCLRIASMEELLSFDVNCPKYLTAFGPSVDGVVIQKDYAKAFITKLEDNSRPFINFRDTKQRGVLSIKSFANVYDVIFGVVSNEAMALFSESDIKHGIDAAKRDRILRTYVRNVYTHHLSEIFYTVVNEYTDWERNAESPKHVRDSTITALTDAQVVAPALLMANFMTESKNMGNGDDDLPKRKTKHFFIVFNHRTNEEDNFQNRGSIDDAELPYFFAAPLVGGFSFVARNNSMSTVTLTKNLLSYINNFIRYGDPNGMTPLDHLSSFESSVRLPEAVFWEEYDPTHQKYVEIGQHIKTKTHFRAHRMSLWLRLIPEIHRSGADAIETGHNIFQNYDDMDLYEGEVRPDPFNRTELPLLQFIGESNNTDIATETLVTSTCLTDIVTINVTRDNGINIEIANYSAYSTALSVTIAIGCSLLILNVLIFAGVYYRRDKSREKAKFNSRNRHFESDSPGYLQVELKRNPCLLTDIEGHGRILPKINFEGAVNCELPKEIGYDDISEAHRENILSVRGASKVSSFRVPQVYCDSQPSGSLTLPKNLDQHLFKSYSNGSTSLLLYPPIIHTNTKLKNNGKLPIQSRETKEI